MIDRAGGVKMIGQDGGYSGYDGGGGKVRPPPSDILLLLLHFSVACWPSATIRLSQLARTETINRCQRAEAEADPFQGRGA